tara:strand:- start:1504 stop:2289 length:786 start_codon:yes stop_codon:yes gene_type:complete
MKVKKYLPSLLTLSNLFLGFLSILFIQRGFFDIGCYLIVLAAILDSFDGKLARKIGVASSFGKEIDSLADLISFCLAPSFLIFNLFYDFTPIETNEFLFLYFAFFSSFPVIMGAIRLARFNVAEENHKNYFIGFPTPMAAITICALVLYKIKLGGRMDLFIHLDIILLPIIILLSFLMISKIQFSKSLLFFSSNNNTTKQIFLLCVGITASVLAIFYDYIHIALLCFSLYYILSNTIFHFINNSIKLNRLKDKLKKQKRVI